jgi:transcriptional regulator GlxA family with amidase domain
MTRERTKSIAFVLYPGTSPLDLVGPLTVLRDLKLGTPYRSVVVSARVKEIASDTPLGLVPARTFEDLPRPFALFVPGGAGAGEAVRDGALVSYVRTAAATAEIVGSVGNGSLVLGAAGLLAGRRVAAHWAYADALEAYGARYATDRWVEDGKFLTAAGSAAGIDAMLHLTARLRSASAARLAQLWMEYDPQPPFGRPDPSDRDAGLRGAILARRAPAAAPAGGIGHGAT